MQRANRLREFVAEIWRWYARHKRTLPWRDLQVADDTQRAYMVLVSEVMLQQTQVPRVRMLFQQFLERFPTIEHLARASNRAVLVAWRGMGYNSRALRLRDAARAIVKGVTLRCERRDGSWLVPRGTRDSHLTMTRREPRRATPISFPHSMEDLLSIPGIGPYTAAAIRNFAFNLPTPCVDVNIERILGRVFGVRERKRVGKRAGEVLRIAVGGGGRTADWHSALMDFGSALCTKRSPKCAQCPLSQGICRSAFKPLPATRLPLREPGRMVGSRFVPNRIVRGKVVELLRDAPSSLTLEAIGRSICLDWSRQHRPWLQGILTGLCRDSLLKNRKRKYVLS